MANDYGPKTKETLTKEEQIRKDMQDQILRRKLKEGAAESGGITAHDRVPEQEYIGGTADEIVIRGGEGETRMPEALAAPQPQPQEAPLAHQEPDFDFLQPPSENEQAKVMARDHAETQQQLSKVRSPTGYSAMDYVAAGATPLLMGLLMGNTGDAFEIAGKGILGMEKREYDGQVKDIEYQRKLASAKATSSGSGKITAKKAADGSPLYFSDAIKRYHRASDDSVYTGPVYAPSGVGEQGQFNQKLTLQRKSNKLEGKGVTFRNNEKGQLVSTDRRYPNSPPIVLGDLSGYSMKERSQARVALKEFNSKGVGGVGDDIEGLKTILSFTDSLNTNNPLAWEGSIITLAKKFNGGGVLTDRDVDRLQLAGSISDRVEQYIKLKRTGQPTAEFEGWMRDLSASMKKGIKKRLQDAIASHLSSQRGISPIDDKRYAELINNSMKPYIDRVDQSLRDYEIKMGELDPLRAQEGGDYSPEDQKLVDEMNAEDEQLDKIIEAESRKRLKKSSKVR